MFYISIEDNGFIYKVGSTCLEIDKETEVQITQEQYSFLQQEDSFKYDYFYNSAIKEITRQLKKDIPIKELTQEERLKVIQAATKQTSEDVLMSTDLNMLTQDSVKQASGDTLMNMDLLNMILDQQNKIITHLGIK